MNFDHYQQIKSKKLFRKAEKIEKELTDYFLDRNNLQFQSEDMDTQGKIFQAIDNIRSFKDNLRYKK